MPSENEINVLKEKLQAALVEAMQSSTAEIATKNDIQISKEQMQKSKPLQEIDAKKKSEAFTTEVTVLLLEKIELLENKIVALESKNTDQKNQLDALEANVSTSFEASTSRFNRVTTLLFQRIVDLEN